MERNERGPRPPLIPWALYNSVGVPSLIAGMHLGRLFQEKAREGVDGRRHLFRRLELHRERLRGCIWFHVSSAGEYEQARPVIRALRERTQGEVPTLLTVFSPSGYARATTSPETDFVEYLPWDTTGAARHLLQILEPRALVFVKYDCWPNLVWSCRRERVRTVLVGASLHRASQRLGRVVRRFFGSVYGALDAIGTISESDAALFVEELGVDPSRLHVTGDTRVEQVVHRWQQAEDAPLPRALRATGWKYFVLGSTWPADERVILAPALDALEAHEELGLIVAPHEPVPHELDRIARRIEEAGHGVSRLSELIEPRTHQRRSTTAAKDPRRWRIILVDSVGVLAEIYRAGRLAYVGGGFTTGVHSVLEPAVCSLPVIFGPRHQNAFEAQMLIDRGAGFSVADRAQATVRLQSLLGDDDTLDRAGAAAVEAVHSQVGATARTLDLVLTGQSR